MPLTDEQLQVIIRDYQRKTKAGETCHVLPCPHCGDLIAVYINQAEETKPAAPAPTPEG